MRLICALVILVILDPSIVFSVIIPEGVLIQLSPENKHRVSRNM